METKTKRRRTRGNGQGTVFKLPNGKWRAEVTLGWDEHRRIVKTKSGFKTKKEALTCLPELRMEPAGINTSIRFKALYELWSKPHFAKVGKDTENGYRAAYKNCEALHYRIFTQMKTKDLQDVVDSCPLGWRSKKDIKTLLGCLYRYAIENDYCAKNYASFVKLPAKGASTKDAFTLDEINKLWKDYNAGNEFTGYLLIMIYTGMRYGEISTIKKENVHLPERYMVGGIKTEAGINREIPICEKIYPVVAKAYLAGKKKILEMHEKVFYNSFRVTCSRASVRSLNPHCCRHTAATALAEAGVQPAVIAAILGHEDYSTTLNYTHISLAEKLKAVNGLYIPSSSAE
ncbi:tyrosine-type recombinase/integrase [Papillibacter cinnamivorans]|uniref:Phage integrase family protein n=1 Tax=Papillibacter cinnamivorans DSM 12816 TaxID=1122930 RepID=A0A1W1YPK5_9FIRM|nr:site-specific integrase [Papillibacter cinnamivorans]SMC38042.1 Phage integrase family protein [Papillibacter cinnamivorans DSM 12816]